MRRSYGRRGYPDSKASGRRISKRKNSRLRKNSCLRGQGASAVREICRPFLARPKVVHAEIPRAERSSRAAHFLLDARTQRVHTGQRKFAIRLLACGATRMTRTLLIDTDTASDDAVALIMALRSKEVRVAAITVVAGNVPVAQATSNALYTAELCAADVPVYSGAEGPLQRKLVTADWFHGADGLGDHGYKPAKRRAEPRHAVDAPIDTVRANPGIDILTLCGIAVRQLPGLCKNSRRLVAGSRPTHVTLFH